MQAFETNELQLAPISSPDDATREVKAAFPFHWGTGTAATAMVYFELEPQMHLGTHTDSAEEVLVVLEGVIEVTVGDALLCLGPGGVAVVPAMEQHDVRSVGDVIAKVCGIFGANATVAVFDSAFSVMGAEPSRISGTPMPEAEVVDAY